MWLPAGRRQIEDVWPGIVATLALWLACGFTFGRYLSDFSYAYVHYYAGLASAMTALVFLYFTAWIFIYGGELNAAIAREFPRRHLKSPDRAMAPEPQPDGGP
jgi:membrane protein